MMLMGTLLLILGPAGFGAYGLALLALAAVAWLAVRPGRRSVVTERSAEPAVSAGHLTKRPGAEETWPGGGPAGQVSGRDDWRGQSSPVGAWAHARWGRRLAPSSDGR